MTSAIKDNEPFKEIAAAEGPVDVVLPNALPKLYQNALKTPAERYNHIRKMKLYSDCQFQVEDQIFDAHKMLLASSSPVFEAMFYGSLAEDTTKPILITDLSPEIFESLLVYIYENKFDIDSVELAKNLMYASQKYMIDSMQEKCRNYVKTTLSPHNAIEAYEFASVFQDSELQAASLKVITRYTATALGTCRYENISIDTFLVIARQEKSSLNSELSLFKALEIFVKRNGILDLFRKRIMDADIDGEYEVNSDYVDQLKIHEVLKAIRFLAMTPEEFVSGPAVSELLLPDEKFAILCNLIARTDSKSKYPDYFCKRLELRTKLRGEPLSDSDKSEIAKLTGSVEKILETLKQL